MIKKRSKEPLELVDHLAELRARAIRCIIYIVIGTTVGWLFYSPMFQLISAPVRPYLQQNHSKFLLTGIAEGFIFKMQMAVIAGIILVLPFMTIEAWMFLAPGLTKAEQRGVKLVAPLSIFLFLAGVAVSYWALPIGVQWLIAQNPPEATFMPSVTQTLTFILKMVLAFGLIFQMPVVLVFLARIGIINSGMLKKYWRHSVVGISIVAAVATPSNDALTMTLMCIPMLFLYLLSIGLVSLVQKKREDSDR